MLELCADKSVTFTTKGIMLSHEQRETCRRFAVFGATTINWKLETKLYAKYYSEMLAELKKLYGIKQ